MSISNSSAWGRTNLNSSNQPVPLLQTAKSFDSLRCFRHMKHSPNLKSYAVYSTLKRFSDRRNVQEIVDALLAEIISKFAEVAMDSTGLETTSASAHFKTRSDRKRKQYVKVSVFGYLR